eukprot:TRINITY_DN18647_c0_g1_i2.p1 TRINITY_DN18647_c0_g1~~TRINITY_DN18647_c0_g1_i2.p1  ORF type:complete len:411 (+),score=20.70 TRINITY_DN18647_c0_g1_i2:59-1291(+)
MDSPLQTEVRSNKTSQCPAHCLDCSDAKTCTLCEYDYTIVAGMCEKSWQIKYTDSCCRSHLNLLSELRPPSVNFQKCFHLAASNPLCNPNLVFLHRAKEQSEFSAVDLGDRNACYCVKQGETCVPYSCPGHYVFERQVLTVSYKVISPDHYCAHKSGLYPYRCLITSLLPGIERGLALTSCEAACNQYHWCLAFSAELDGNACSLVPTSEYCPVGSASAGPVAANMFDLVASASAGYTCVSKTAVSYWYELVGLGACRGGTGVKGKHQHHDGISTVSQCQALCNTWFDCEGFSVASGQVKWCELWTRASGGDGQRGQQCYAKRLPTARPFWKISSPDPRSSSPLSERLLEHQQAAFPLSLLVWGLLFAFCCAIAVRFFRGARHKSRVVAAAVTEMSNSSYDAFVTDSERS